jgi:serine/threonine protein kinase
LNLCEEDFNKIALVGTGAYASVYLVRHKVLSQKICVMKKIRKEKALAKDPQLEGIKMERAILARANHPYIMELYFTFQTETHFFMGMEFCNGGELFTLITSGY